MEYFVYHLHILFTVFVIREKVQKTSAGRAAMGFIYIIKKNKCSFYYS